MGSPETAIDMVLKVKALSGDAKNNPDLIKSVDRSIAGCLSRMELSFAQASALYHDDRMDVALAKMSPDMVDPLALNEQDKAQMRNFIEQLKGDAEARLQVTMQEKRGKWLDSQKPFETGELTGEKAQEALIKSSTEREGLEKKVLEQGKVAAQQLCANQVIAEFVNRAYPEFAINTLVDDAIKPKYYARGNEPPRMEASYFLSRALKDTNSTQWGSHTDLLGMTSNMEDVAKLLRNLDQSLRSVDALTEYQDGDTYKKNFQATLQRYVPSFRFLSDMIQNDDVREAMKQVFGASISSENLIKLVDTISGTQNQPDATDVGKADTLGDTLKREIRVQQEALQKAVDGKISDMVGIAQLEVVRADQEYKALLDRYQTSRKTLEQEVTGAQAKLQSALAELQMLQERPTRFVGPFSIGKRDHTQAELTAIEAQNAKITTLRSGLDTAQAGLQALVEPSKPAQNEALAKLKKLQKN